MTPSARVSLVGRHAEGRGGCARDNGKGEKESLTVCVQAAGFLCQVGHSFPFLSLMR